jgi:hypothetical protein
MNFKTFGLSFVLSFFLVIIIISFTDNNTDFDKDELKYYKTYYFEKGKTVGRNAMLEYLRKTGELKDTTINLNINQYIKIEERYKDSILHNKKISR